MATNNLQMATNSPQIHLVGAWKRSPGAVIGPAAPERGAGSRQIGAVGRLGQTAGRISRQDSGATASSVAHNGTALPRTARLETFSLTSSGKNRIHWYSRDPFTPRSRSPMKQTQDNIVTMFETTLAFLDKNNNIWKNRPLSLMRSHAPKRTPPRSGFLHRLFRRKDYYRSRRDHFTEGGGGACRSARGATRAVSVGLWSYGIDRRPRRKLRSPLQPFPPVDSLHTS